MKNIILFSFFLSGVLICLAQSTSHSYHETFNSGTNPGWGFLAANSSIIIQDGKLTLTSPSDDVIHMLLPIGATTGDFSFRAVVAGDPSGIQGGGFGRMGFKSLVAIQVDDDSIFVIYTEDIQSYSQPNFTTLASYHLPGQVNSVRLDAIKSGNDLLLEAFINDTSFYEGGIYNADEGLFSGQMLAFVIRASDETLVWSIDEVNVLYNPVVESQGNYTDEFDDPNSPWFRFGDFENLAQSLTINNSRLNFNYSELSETALYVIPPVGAVTDFSLEIEGGGGSSHDAPFSLSRFFDYRNYTTFFIEDDTLYFGYADNAYEPTTIDYAVLNPTTTIKLKFSIQGNSPAVYKAWANDQLIMNSTTNINSDRLTSGHLAFGFDRGNTMDAYFNYAALTYSQLVTEVNDAEINTPEVFQLYQNYPNPFNPATKIRYSIPSFESHDGASQQNVSLKVYDVLGEEIATLVNEFKSPGIYEVQWNAEELSSGVYFYRLTAGVFQSTKKFVLMR